MFISKNQKRLLLLLTFGYLILANGLALAADTLFEDVGVVALMSKSMAPAVNNLLVVAISWLGTFAVVQMVITNINLIKSGGDIENVFAKLLGSLLWVGFCIYVMQNGPAFIANVGHSFFAMAGLSLPSPGYVLSSMTIGIGSLLGTGIVVDVASNFAGLFLIIVIVLLLFIAGMVAVKIFMLQLELALVVMLSPLSFSFLGLDALKDQGIAPFKALISLGYRTILVTVISSAFVELFPVIWDTLKNISIDTGSDNLLPIPNPLSIAAGLSKAAITLVSGIMSLIMLAFLLYKSDSIAASLASGSTSFGTADVASAAAMGAAVGAAATGGLSAAASAVSNNASTSAASVTNASSQGRGIQSYPPLSDAPPLKDPMTYGERLANGPRSPRESDFPMPEQSGNASNSGIGGRDAGSGGNDDLGKKLDKLAEQMGGKPSLGRRLSEANQHVAQEKSATHISINTNASH